MSAIPPEILVRLRSDRSAGEADVDVVGILRLLWSERLAIAISILACVAAGVAFVMFARPWYKAEVLLVPVETRVAPGLAPQLGQLGGLASIAGINLGSPASKSEPLAVLKSRDLTLDFLRKENRLDRLLDERQRTDKLRWIVSRNEELDARDAVIYFERSIRRVAEDRRTGLVTLEIRWIDAVEASRWADGLVRQVNDVMRQRAISTSEANISYLQSELSRTKIVSLQQAIGRLLEIEIQQLMLARGNEQYAFRIVDGAQVPKRKFYPRLSRVLPVALIIGVFIAALFVALKRRPWLERYGCDPR